MSSTSLDSSTSSYFSMICLMLKIDLFLVPFLSNDAISISFLDFGVFVASSTGIGITTSLCCFGTGLSFFPFGGRVPNTACIRENIQGTLFLGFGIAPLVSSNRVFYCAATTKASVLASSSIILSFILSSKLIRSDPKEPKALTCRDFVITSNICMALVKRRGTVHNFTPFFALLTVGFPF